MATEQELTLDKLSSGDRPSILALGVAAAESLKVWGLACFQVDVLGRIQIIPPADVTLKVGALVKDEELDSISEEQAVQVLVAQGASDEEAVAYFKRRRSREGAHGDAHL